MPVMVHLNIHRAKDGEFDMESELFLITAFNKLPSDLTAENIPLRQNRPWLISITEELNSRPTKIVRNYDVLDVLMQLQRLRKAGRLRNRASVTSKSSRGAVDTSENDMEFDDDRNDDAHIIDPSLRDSGGRVDIGKL